MRIAWPRQGHVFFKFWPWAQSDFQDTMRIRPCSLPKLFTRVKLQQRCSVSFPIAPALTGPCLPGLFLFVWGIIRFTLPWPREVSAACCPILVTGLGTWRWIRSASTRSRCALKRVDANARQNSMTQLRRLEHRYKRVTCDSHHSCRFLQILPCLFDRPCGIISVPLQAAGS